MFGEKEVPLAGEAAGSIRVQRDRAARSNNSVPWQEAWRFVKKPFSIASLSFSKFSLMVQKLEARLVDVLYMGIS
jgi:hypothetical protein